MPAVLTDRNESLRTFQPRQISPNLSLEESFRQLNEAYIELFGEVKQMRQLLYSLDRKINS